MRLAPWGPTGDAAAVTSDPPTDGPSAPAPESGTIDWQAGLRARSAADVGVYVVVGLLLLLALVVKPVWSALDPALPASEEVYGPGGTKGMPIDPWGKQWVWDGKVVRSFGPDGKDDRGGGDDVLLLRHDDPALRAWRDAPEALFGLAVLLAIGWELGRALGRALLAPRDDLGAEVPRAAFLATPLAALLAGVAALGLRLRPDLAPDAVFVVVPRWLALVGTCWVTAFCVALAVRLSRARAAEPA